MPTHSSDLRLNTAGDGDVIDLTERVEAIVADAGVQDGAVSLFVPGSTAAITTMEFERGGIHDLRLQQRLAGAAVDADRRIVAPPAVHGLGLAHLPGQIDPGEIRVAIF